jgi:beta-phosphoglucomutase-like phosphatase (HAD superfamily)
MSSLRYRGIILDHDDTAVNSTATIHYPAHLKVMSVLRPHVTPITLEEWFLKNFHPGIVHYLTKELGMTAEEMEVEYRIWREFTSGTIPQFYPGFVEALREYRARGGIVAVVSHSEKDIIERDYHFCTSENPFLPDIVFGWDYREDRRKPSGFPVREVLKAFDLRAEHALIIDDLKPGVIMGKVTGVPVATAGWGHSIRQIEQYMRAHSLAYFETVRQFREYILAAF